jgi:hypothetical protein
MLPLHFKGERRARLDQARLEAGEPKANFQKNRTLHSRYPAESKKAFHRKKGRNRFKTGKKAQRKGKTVVVK